MRSTQIRPNHEPSVYDVVWGHLLKIMTGVITVLLTVGVINLFTIKWEVSALSTAVAAYHEDLKAVQADVKTAKSDLVNHLIEVERLKGIYITKDEFERYEARRPQGR